MQKYFNKQALWKLTKDVLRIALFGAISAVLSWASTKIASLPPDSAYAITGTLILALVDKYIHYNSKIQANGLVKF